MDRIVDPYRHISISSLKFKVHADPHKQVNLRIYPLNDQISEIRFWCEGVDTKIDLFSWISVDFELETVNRDFSVGVYNSIHSETEDIFHRLEGGSDFEFPKERLFLF